MLADEQLALGCGRPIVFLWGSLGLKHTHTQLYS